jgi:hypothetical protein
MFLFQPLPQLILGRTVVSFFHADKRHILKSFLKTNPEYYDIYKCITEELACTLSKITSKHTEDNVCVNCIFTLDFRTN